MSKRQTSAGKSSVSFWIEQVKEGDESAARKLWDRYVTDLIAHSRKRLRSSPRRENDEHDVVQQAFEAFFRAAKNGQLTQLNDRNDLWRLLVTIADNKVVDQQKHRLREKRGGGHVRGESVFVHSDGSQGGSGIDGRPGVQVDPAVAAEAVDRFRWLMKNLDEQQRRIARQRMEGYSVEEIAAKEGCVPETIRRKIRLIQKILSDGDE